MDTKRRAIEDVRSAIADVFLLVAVIAAVPALAGSLYRIAVTGWLPIMAFQIGLFLVLVCVVLCRRQVPYVLRAGFIVAAYLALGLAGSWQLGLVGSAVVFLVAAPALSAIFFGTRAGAAVLVFTVVATGAVGAYIVAVGRLPPFDPSLYALQPSSWITMIVGLAFVAASLLAALIMYNNYLVAALRDANRNEDELTRLVEERTAELHETQAALIRRERLAVLGQLTGTVAHEIRNPLGAIANSFSVIKARCSGANLDLGAALDRTDRNIRRCDRIITELLDFARAKGIEPEDTLLRPWLADILREQQIPDGISVQLDVPADAPAIRFDPDAMRRAVVNVIDNACHAMQSAGDEGSAAEGKLTISSRVTGDRVEIAIADTGPGIPTNDLARVLEPLFSTRSFGTGLGLPIAHRVMEDHGGGIEIDSGGAGGTRVILWLPLRGGGEGEPSG